MSFSDKLRFFGNTEFAQTQQTFAAGFQAVTAIHGKDGRDGRDGEDGTTPVKGVDYWTEADRKEIIEAVLLAVGLPTVTEEDDGKILQVVNGVWSVVNFSENQEPDGAAQLGKALLGSMILGGVY